MPAAGDIPEWERGIDRLATRIRAVTGLALVPRDLDRLRDLVASRTAETGHGSLPSYLGLLDGGRPTEGST